jgi:hypothetical protein
LSVLALAGLCTAVAVARGGGGGGGEAGGGEGGGGGGSDVTAQVIGRTANTPDPSCPDDPDTDAGECQVVGSVTAFQTAVNGRYGVFRVPVDGRVVAWSIAVARSSEIERNFFGDLFGNDAFGGRPSANIAVIRRKDGTNFRLRGKSAPVNLAPYYGKKPIFTIEEPLRARAGDVIALTVPTWAPNFAFGLDEDDQWLASRRSDFCEPGPTDEDKEEFARRSRPHTKVGSTKNYGCSYSTARLVYWAYFAPDKS